nr:helix-turn-helix transcriptional regulator [Bifidobacterium dentium]
MKQIVDVAPQQLGEAVKSAIKQAGLTQEEAGIKTGIPRNSLNRKIHGGTFNFDELTRISQVTGRKLSTIIADAEALANA